MKGKVFLLSLLIYSSITAFSQKKKKVDPDHTNFYKPATANVTDIKIEAQKEKLRICSLPIWKLYGTTHLKMQN